MNLVAGTCSRWMRSRYRVIAEGDVSWRDAPRRDSRRGASCHIAASPPYQITGSVAIWLLYGLLASSPASAASLRCEFRSGQFDNQKLVLFGSAAATFVKPTPNGLEIALPADKQQKLVKELGFAPKVVVSGNFVITGSFEVVHIDDPDTGYGIGPAIYIATRTDQEDAATVSRLKRIKEGEIVSSHSAKTVSLPDGRTKREHSVKMEKTEIVSGRLRLRREGTALSFSFSTSESGDDFQEIQTKEFTNADVTQLRFLLNRNGATSAATIRWRDISIEADTLIPVMAPGRLPTRPVWPWVVGAIAVTVACGGVWFWKKRS